MVNIRCRKYPSIAYCPLPCLISHHFEEARFTARNLDREHKRMLIDHIRPLNGSACFVGIVCQAQRDRTARNTGDRIGIRRAWVGIVTIGQHAHIVAIRL